MRRTCAAATWVLALVVAEVIITAGAVLTVGGGYFDRPNATLTLSNAIIASSFAAAGFPIGRHRPDNPIGWLMLLGGFCYALTAAGYSVLVAFAPVGPHSVGWRVLATMTNGGWPWAISLVLPLVLLIFPDGHLLTRRWRGLVVLVCLNAVGFEATAVLPAQTLTSELGVAGYPGGRWSTGDGWLPGLTTAVGLSIYVVAVGSLALRYRRGDDRTRRQLLWVLFGSGLMVITFMLSALLGIDSILLGILPVVFVPVSIAVALLRHQVLDIRLVVSRTLAYVLLTAGIVLAYVGVVASLDSILRRQVGLGASVLATLLIALAFNPVRSWLQRVLDRTFYGARGDPVRVVEEVGARLGEIDTDAGGLGGVLAALCQVLRFPSASIVVDGQQIAAYGPFSEPSQAIGLRQGDRQIGELVMGLRSGDNRLAPADERVIGLLSASLTVAVQLGRTREQLVSAREEERRRLQRDLHDGLGPTLTGVVLKADAARRLVRSDPDQAIALMTDIGVLTTATVEDVRQLINELRPPALDGLGLIGALREHASSMARRRDGSPLTVTVEAGELGPPLPAAVEVAAYRIVTEALTNVVRHSSATRATVSLSADATALTVTVRDDGTAAADPWPAGIGLTSVSERAIELGGTSRAGPDADGGLVSVVLPVGVER